MYSDPTARRAPRALPALAFALVLAPSLGARAQTLVAPSRAPAVVAAPAAAVVAGTRVDPYLDALFGHRARYGETLGAFARSGRFEREGTLPVVVRFAAMDAPRTAAALAALAARGVAWGREGRPLASGAYVARVDEAGVRALEADPRVARVEVTLPRADALPLEDSARQTAVDAARRAVYARDGVTLDGRGVVIADIDSGVFVFHPGLFRADAGTYRWVDANRDGVLTPNTDGVDLDGDGALAPAEVLRPLFARAVTRTGLPLGARVTAFRPDRDWLYLDTDGNGARDYGAAFPEDTPAYGEPLFVADDANRDDRVQASERLLRLGSSKIRAVLVPQELTRGSAEAGVSRYDVRDDAGLLAQTGHGTGVAGILVGGVPSVSRWLGLAPGADLLVAAYYTLGDMMGTAGGIQWALDRGAHVVLTEFAGWLDTTLDGSSEENALLDAAVNNGVVAVSPAGNLAEGSKHRTIRLAPGPNRVVLRTDSVFDGARLIRLGLHHRGEARPLGLELTVPGPRQVALPESAARGTQLSGYTAYVMNRATPRGTRERHVLLFTSRGHARGEYVLTITLGGDTPLEVDAYVGDDRSSWGGGMTFDGNNAARTLCHPATGDRTIAVAAYVLHGGQDYGAWGREGERAGYSSRGPRLDGDTGIDITAPDNPLSLTQPEEPRVPYAAVQPFGGTSGAGPHVAAAAALLRQLFPREPAPALVARLLDNARTDEVITGREPTLTGRGRLDVAAALGLRAADGRPPGVVLRAPRRVALGARASYTVDAVDDEPASALRARWDTDYDGAPDTDWVPLGDHAVDTGTLGVRDVRVEVRDGQGHVAADTARVEVVRPEALDDAGADGGSQGVRVGGGCGCVVAGALAGSRAARTGAAGLAVAAALYAAARRRARRTRR